MLKVILTVYSILTFFVRISINSVIPPKITNKCKKVCFKYRRFFYNSIYPIALVTTKTLKSSNSTPS